MIKRLYEEKRMRVDHSCKVLRVSRSGYCKWRDEMPAKTQLEQQYCGEITKAWEDSGRTYGSPRIYQELRSKGISISEKKVAQLMKKQGISGAGRKSYSYRTTDSVHSHEVAARHFKTETDPVPTLSANEVWVGDITYIRLQRGFCFLAVYMDVALRKIVGYSVRDTLQAEGVIEALKMAIGKEHPVAGLIVHTDRGVQYACESYRALIEQYGYKMSMSRKGNCYDNAFIESFFRSLKVELIHRHVFKTIQEARAAIFHYIEVWYNRQRRHSSLGYMSPVDYERFITKPTHFCAHYLGEDQSTKHSVDYTPDKDIQISHGVEVAGVAAARGYNGFGVRGVAPLATIISVGMRPSISQHRIAAAAHQNEITAVYNNSWGVQEFVDVSSMWYRAIETGLSEGFYGKGSVYVWATANEYGENSANFEPVTNYHATIAVCAVNYRGVHNDRSVTGANLWVCGLSQDSTDNDDWKYYIVTTTDYKERHKDRIGDNSSGLKSRYITIFSGTSAATPMVTGVVALMRQANPNLGWRDVKLILAETARKVEKTDAGWLQSGIRYGSTNERYHFSHKYGFGLVDAEEAVKLAETWVNVPERVADTVVADIPPAVIDTEKLTRTITVQSDIDFIEHIDATIDIKERRGSFGGLLRALIIKLKSPSGTISTLASDDDDRGGGEIKWRYGSARHLGEDASGEWQLMIEVKRGPKSQRPFEFQGWELRIRGFKVEMDAVADGDLSYLSVNKTPLTLSLSGAHWKKGLQPSNFSLKNAPSGLSIAEVRRTSDTQVQLKLDFDGTLDKAYDFQVQANIGTVTNLSRALVSNDIEIARVALKTTTIPQSTVGTQYHYTMENAFASPTSLTYIIKLVDEEGNELTTQIPGLTIEGHTIRGIPQSIGTHRLRVEATRTIDKATRTEYFVFSVEPHTIEVHLRVLLEGLQPPNP